MATPSRPGTSAAVPSRPGTSAAATLGGVLPPSAPLVGPLGREALVIGNSDYLHLRSVKHAVADAQDVAVALRAQGFRVLCATNLDSDLLRANMVQFESRVVAGQLALVYFAGHGAVFDGKHHLLPVDYDPDVLAAATLSTNSANANRVLAGHTEAIRQLGGCLDTLLHNLQAKGLKHSIVLLDACRKCKAGAGSAGESSSALLTPPGTPGPSPATPASSLPPKSPVPSPASSAATPKTPTGGKPKSTKAVNTDALPWSTDGVIGSLVAFACRPGSSAVDGVKPGARNSVFAEVFLRYAFMQQLSLHQAMAMVVKMAGQATGGEQQPCFTEDGSLPPGFKLALQPGAAAAAGHRSSSGSGGGVTPPQQGGLRSSHDGVSAGATLQQRLSGAGSGGEARGGLQGLPPASPSGGPRPAAGLAGSSSVPPSPAGRQQAAKVVQQ